MKVWSDTKMLVSAFGNELAGIRLAADNTGKWPFFSMRTNMASQMFCLGELVAADIASPLWSLTTPFYRLGFGRRIRCIFCICHDATNNCRPIAFAGLYFGGLEVGLFAVESGVKTSPQFPRLRLHRVQSRISSALSTESPLKLR